MAPVAVDAGAKAPRPLALVLVLRAELCLLLAEEADAGVPRLRVGLVRLRAGGGQVVAACRRFTSGLQAQAPSCTRHSRIRAVGPTRNRTSGGARRRTGGQLLAAPRIGLAAPGEGALRRDGQCVGPPRSTRTGDSTRGPTCSVMASPASSSADFLRNVPLPPSACAAAAATAASAWAVAYVGQRDTVILHSHCLSLAVIP